MLSLARGRAAECPRQVWGNGPRLVTVCGIPAEAITEEEEEGRALLGGGLSGQRAHHQQHHRGRHNGACGGVASSHHGQAARPSSQECRGQLSDASAVGNVPPGPSSRSGASQGMHAGVERLVHHPHVPGTGDGTSTAVGGAPQTRHRTSGNSTNSTGGGTPGNSLAAENTVGEATSRGYAPHGGGAAGANSTPQVSGQAFPVGLGKRRLCPYLTRKNGCYKGPACRYAHSEEEALSAALMQQASIRNSNVASPAVASAPSSAGTPTNKPAVSGPHSGLGLDTVASPVSAPLGGAGVGGPVALMLDPASTAGLLLIHSQPGDISAGLAPREDGLGLSPAPLPVPLPVRQVAGVPSSESLNKGQQLARCVCTTGGEKLFANALKTGEAAGGGEASSAVVSSAAVPRMGIGQQNVGAAHHHPVAVQMGGHHGLPPNTLAPGALHFQQGALPTLVMNSPGGAVLPPVGPTSAVKGGDIQTVGVCGDTTADAAGPHNRQTTGVGAGRPVASENSVPVPAEVSAGAASGMVGTGVMTGVQPLAAVRLPSQTPPAGVAPYWQPAIQASQQGVGHPSHPQAAGALLAPGVGSPAVGTLVGPGAAGGSHHHHHHHHPGSVAPGCLPAFGLIAPPAMAGGGQQPGHHGLMLGGHQGTAVPAAAILPSGAHQGFYFAGAPGGSSTLMSIMPIPLMHFAASTEELNAAAPLFYED